MEKPLPDRPLVCNGSEVLLRRENAVRTDETMNLPREGEESGKEPDGEDAQVEPARPEESR